MATGWTGQAGLLAHSVRPGPARPRPDPNWPSACGSRGRHACCRPGSHSATAAAAASRLQQARFRNPEIWPRVGGDATQCNAPRRRASTRVARGRVTDGTEKEPGAAWGGGGNEPHCAMARVGPHGPATPRPARAVLSSGPSASPRLAASSPSAIYTLAETHESRRGRAMGRALPRPSP